MRVLLVSPIKDVPLAEAPPMGLGYLATSLKRNGYDVNILDCSREKMNFDDFKRYISSSNYDVIGFTVFSDALVNVKKSIEIIKKIKPDTLTIVGGPHPSAAPEHTLTYLEACDYAFRGEAELTLPIFLKYVNDNDLDRLKKIQGLIWRENKKVESNEPSIHKEIDNFDPVAWDLIEPQKYHQPGSLAPKGWITIITSRGCPFRCTFCSVHVITGLHMRYRSINNVLQEIKYIDSNYKIRKFTIMDENFTLNKARVEEFCHKIMESGIKYQFQLTNGVRLDTLTEDLLILMKRAGFSKRMAVGIESGSDRILKMIKKNLSKEKVKEKIKLMNHVGFKPIGYFILGFPTETKEEMQETIDFAVSLKLYRASFTCFLPLPGTAIYHDLVQNGELPPDFDFTFLTTDSVPYSPKGISRQDLLDIRKKAILKFHLRPRIIWDFMQDYSSFRFATSKLINIFLRKRNAPE
tara:strand:+ start:841 stop:2235 length:1395 start_codon:yes stop_codon:yes gene_type:complete